MDLTQAPLLGTLLRRPALQRAAQWVMVGALALLVWSAWGMETIPGVPDPHPLIYTHGATLLFWVVWFMGLILLAPLVGRAWCGVCPVGYLTDRLGRVGLNLPWPSGGWRWFGPLAIFGAGAAGALFFDVHKSPGQTALLVAAMVLFAFVTALFWRRSAFCGRFCPVGVVLSLYARHAPVRVAARDAGTCARCADHGCVSRKGVWKRWDLGSLVIHKKIFRGGCPVALHPPTMDPAQCLLCLECVRNCPSGNLGVELSPARPAHPISSAGAALMPFLAGLVALALVRTWPAVRDALSPLAYPPTWVWGSWFGVVMPGVLLFGAPTLAWVSARAAGTDHDVPPTADNPGPKTSPEAAKVSWGQWARELATPFAGAILGAHVAVALVKLNAKVAYLPYLLYDPFGVTTYLAINVSGALPLPDLVLPLAALRYVASGALAYGVYRGARELFAPRFARHPWPPMARAALVVGYGLLCGFYGATLVHWMFGGRG